MSCGEAHVNPGVPGYYDHLPDEILLTHEFPNLGLSDLAVLAGVNRRSNALVKRDARGGTRVVRLSDFDVTSVAMLKWAHANGHPWSKRICHRAQGGHLEVLQWAREQDPPCTEFFRCLRAWSWMTCTLAAEERHLEFLQWAREYDSPKEQIKRRST
jgi:hypothetical protein